MISNPTTCLPLPCTSSEKHWYQTCKNGRNYLVLQVLIYSPVNSKRMTIGWQEKLLVPQMLVEEIFSHVEPASTHITKVFEPKKNIIQDYKKCTINLMHVYIHVQEAPTLHVFV